MQAATTTAGLAARRGALRPAVMPAPKPVCRKSDRAERAEVLTVLIRAALDPAFIGELTYHPCEALAGYHLSLEAREAIESGDVHWIELHVGTLDPVERTWLDCRLQQEIW